MFWESTKGADLVQLGEACRKAAEEQGCFISSVSVYGNPLKDDEAGIECLSSLAAAVEAAPAFGCSLVSCFAGRPPGRSVPDSIDAWRQGFAPLVDRVCALGLHLAFENCRIGDSWKTGKWNIAINPDAWELMFKALDSESLGLEWEPCHQLESLADPLAQARDWVGRFFHIHGKDARIDRSLLAARGLHGARRWHASCLPGNGDTEWAELFRILSDAGYRGTVDIEGWNDQEWAGERELEGQRRSLAYLKRCRSC
jgi:sugar phosphate isomerase/epimerase